MRSSINSKTLTLNVPRVVSGTNDENQRSDTTSANIARGRFYFFQNKMYTYRGFDIYKEKEVLIASNGNYEIRLNMGIVETPKSWIETMKKKIDLYYINLRYE